MLNRLDKTFAKLRMKEKNTRKQLNHKRKFKSFGQSSLKSYRRKRTDEQVRKYAEGKRQQRRLNPTRAEEAFAKILRAAGINFEREAIFLNGDKFVLLDFYLPGHHLAIECDGNIHAKQSAYDQGRDKWLCATHKIKTIRFRNEEILREPDAVRQRLQTQMELT